MDGSFALPSDSENRDTSPPFRADALDDGQRADAAISYVTYAPEQSPFETLIIDLTHRCNMECANCYLPDRTVPDLDIEGMLDVLSRLPRRVFVRLAGGEPTLRRDLPEIVHAIRRLGHRVTLMSNGLRLSRSELCIDLRSAGLRWLYLSMNGADDDDVYRVIDNGPYAKLKTRALTNAFRHGFAVQTGTVIARGVNERIMQRQVEVFTEAARAAGVTFDDRPWSLLPPILRFRSVGPIGRHMTGRSLGLDDLCSLASESFGLSVEEVSQRHVASGLDNLRDAEEDGNSVAFTVPTPLGAVHVRLIDWTGDENGVPDPQSLTRGRITTDWRLAPYYEDVKANERTA